jgi:hypothetical protein
MEVKPNRASLQNPCGGSGIHLSFEQNGGSNASPAPDPPLTHGVMASLATPGGIHILQNRNDPHAANRGPCHAMSKDGNVPRFKVFLQMVFGMVILMPLTGIF